MKRVCRYTGILLSVSVIGAAVLLIGAALTLYSSAVSSEEPAFTAEKLSGCFFVIKWPLISALGLSSVLCVIRLCLPASEHAHKWAHSDFKLSVPHTRRNTMIRLCILFLSLVFILLGLKNGGMKDVWYKAKTICTECIGLG